MNIQETQIAEQTYLSSYKKVHTNEKSDYHKEVNLVIRSNYFLSSVTVSVLHVTQLEKIKNWFSREFAENQIPNLDLT